MNILALLKLYKKARKVLNKESTLKDSRVLVIFAPEETDFKFYNKRFTI